MKREPEWLDRDDVVVFHAQLIAAFGGAAGIRDEGLLESALARPRHVFADESQDLVVLAGAYAHGLARNHAFVDGNKRVAFATARVFLAVNGMAFDPPQAEAVVMTEGLASGSLAQEDFVRWLRKHTRRRRRPSR